MDKRSYDIRINGDASSYSNAEALEKHLAMTLGYREPQDVAGALRWLEGLGIDTSQVYVTEWGESSEPALGDDIVSQQSGDEWLTDYENDYKGDVR